MSNTPDLTGYHIVHRALRRGSRRLADAVAAFDGQDRRRAVALQRYWAGFAHELRTHHMVEDEYFFPALRQRVNGVAGMTDRTDADHLRVDELLDEATVAMRRIGATDEHRRRAAEILDEIAEHLEEHLSFEDADILPLFAQHFTAEEYLEIDQHAVKAVGKGKAAAFTIPFIVAVATEEEHARMWKEAPLALKLLWRATRGRHAQLEAAALGGVPAPVPAAA